MLQGPVYFNEAGESKGIVTVSQMQGKTIFSSIETVMTVLSITVDLLCFIKLQILGNEQSHL